MTGMYNLCFIFCEPKLKGLVITRKTIWKNPIGYLPGRMAPLMTFYGLMSLAYLLLGIVWFSQYARFWREILQLQNCITLVISLGIFEMTLLYFEYANFNATGIRSTGITIWAVTFGVVKKTISRLIILVVSIGYGVVRPTLGGLTSKVLLLGATFFLASYQFRFWGPRGWIVPTGNETKTYNQWAQRNRFHVDDDLSSMFPNIYHVAVEESVLMPSVLSRNGVHSFPSLFLQNQTSRVRYRGLKDLDSLVHFYKDITGQTVSVKAYLACKFGTPE